MTVQELIKHLQDFPPDLPVVTCIHEDADQVWTLAGPPKRCHYSPSDEAVDRTWGYAVWADDPFIDPQLPDHDHDHDHDIRAIALTWG